jgi:hypothetical protein
LHRFFQQLDFKIGGCHAIYFSHTRAIVTPLLVDGSVTTIVVTKENQQKKEVEFTLMVEKYPDPKLDTDFVKLVVTKQGKPERLEVVGVDGSSSRTDGEEWGTG